MSCYNGYIVHAASKGHIVLRVLHFPSVFITSVVALMIFLTLHSENTALPAVYGYTYKGALTHTGRVFNNLCQGV